MATKLNIKRLCPDAQIPFKNYDDDFCSDCRAVWEKEISPNVWQYGLGFALQTANEFDGSMLRGVTIRPRSSIWETGMILTNSPGTVDTDEYTGEVKVTFYHVMTGLPRYKVGEKICQLHIDHTEVIDFNEVSELRPTKRGASGHGSTGK